ncbi:Ankyrin repeat family protein isoform 1 [Hibiscus syriacus]|uniref:Ankyrin repeat family protein isoform 1 n=1 Tax=Hibiscus syriacus TaxID=106335 RepID=A0A6A2YXF2_HIBSY|nr:Ankyrin repeat family protein isoform 1 [Hibiscus syriacus]
MSDLCGGFSLWNLLDFFVFVCSYIRWYFWVYWDFVFITVSGDFSMEFKLRDHHYKPPSQLPFFFTLLDVIRISGSDVISSSDCNFKVKETERWVDLKQREPESNDDGQRVSLLTEAWGALLADRQPEENDARVNKHLGARSGAGKFPPWTTWKGSLNMYPATATDRNVRSLNHQPVSDGAHPPWIVGSDEENYPRTRKVQRDIGIHQQPINCSDPNIKFIVADWEVLPGFGIGAQLVGMTGLLAIAINEKRVLVTVHYNQADHNGCKASHSSWSCYFFLETSRECRDRAFKLMKNKEAWEKGIIKQKDDYKSKEIWTGKIPRVWGDPWSYLQPTTDINGSLIAVHHKMDQRWWRAQHAAFGEEAAKMVLASIDREWPKVITNKPKSDIEEFVWSNHRLWVPRLLLSMHEVIDKTKSYLRWNFYYTNVKRQVGNASMAAYEASLGRKTSTNYPLVNFLMAVESNSFIGALGSTWCFLIDGMRNTGGKVMAGYLSVNKDRFW